MTGKSDIRISIPDDDAPRTAIFIPGGAEAVGRVLEACARENGGHAVGNPTVASGAFLEESGAVTIVIIEDRADRSGWWLEWARVHGWKAQKKTS
jgi:hypothetical protein